jgi:short subunit fatty acids transporter
LSKAKTKDKAKSKNVALPSPMRMVWGALAAYWLRDIIHPAFTLIAVMILLMIPVLIADMFFPERKSIEVDNSEAPTDDNEEEDAAESV